MAPLHPVAVANHTRPSLFASTKHPPRWTPLHCCRLVRPHFPIPLSGDCPFRSASHLYFFYPRCQFPQASFPFGSQDTTSWPNLATKSSPLQPGLRCVMIPRDGPPSHLIGHHRSSPPAVEMRCPPPPPSPFGFLSSDRAAQPPRPGQARRSCCVAPKRRCIARLSSHHHSSTWGGNDDRGPGGEGLVS